MKFFLALLINPRLQQSPICRSFRKSSRSLYNPSVKWKSFEKKSFTPLFEDYAPDLCSSSYLVTLFLLPPLRRAPSSRIHCESFLNLTSSRSFCIPVSEKSDAMAKSDF